MCACFVESSLRRCYGIEPEPTWETRESSLSSIGYCAEVMWLEKLNIGTPTKSPRQIVEQVTEFYIPSTIHHLIKIDQIAGPKQEKLFNFWGVPRPVWQLLVAMIANGATPDATG